ncbi:MAG: TlpA family protein disulfide reductase [Gammaproteobacteria bacterium]|nr:TlpA family protein disulfide reductase [Gammaproteobacteria bacterium]NIR97436.1 TlpA family protein disulfide reductase [Gammaproteobacteria bacterium]
MRAMLGLVIGVYLWLPAVCGAEPQTLEHLAERPPAPALALKDVDGTLHRLEDYRGRVVIVNFWATWCPPCRREMPSMERAWNRLKGHGVIMLAVDVGEDADTVFTFTADYPVTFPLLLDQEGDVVRAWPVLGLPTTFIVDPEGRLAYQAIGGREWDAPELLETIRALAP